MAMSECKYKMSLPEEKKLCGYYIDNVKIKGKPYAHYPECGKEGCPLINKEKN